jgi:hypothetical protein
MRTSHFSLRLARVAAVCFLLVGVNLLGAPVFGLMNVISANVGGGEGTPLYDSASHTWGVPAARMCDGYAFGTDVPYFDVSPLSEPTGYGSLAWSGNPLSHDQSTGYGLAIGVFGGGGTFSMTGTLYDWMGPAASGLLLSGTVDGFTFRETGDNQNNMELYGDATITPTGGWLFAQGYLTPQYALSFQAVPCQQDGGDVVNFQGDIITFTSMQFFMVGIPEPCTAMLLALAGVLLCRSRRA